MDYKAENVVQNVGAMAEVTSVFYNSIVRQVPKDVALVLTQHFMDITIARPVNINLSASAAAKAAQAQKQAMEAQRRIMEEKRRQMAQQEPQNRSDAPQEPTAPSDPTPDAPENRPED